MNVSNVDPAEVGIIKYNGLQNNHFVGSQVVFSGFVSERTKQQRCEVIFNQNLTAAQVNFDGKFQSKVVDMNREGSHILRKAAQAAVSAAGKNRDLEEVEFL